VRREARVDAVSELVVVSEEVRSALDGDEPLVALETTLVAHGFPAPHGVEVGLASEAAVREAGAVPATVGVLDGRVRVGLDPDELDRFTPDARKLGPRDVAACAARGDVGATTVGGTLSVASLVGIRFLGTGGIGGVHRGFPERPDVSADIPALARTRALVACSGVKSLLDVPATMELLETLGVPVLGYGTDTLPLFYSANGGPALQDRLESASEAALVAAAHWQLGGAGLLLANPPPQSVDVDELIEEALAAAEASGIAGQAVTPYVLGFLHERSEGRTREVNRELIVANARLAAEVAVAFAAL
jgi:pseudouridine-5'-phosphate glycosidase